MSMLFSSRRRRTTGLLIVILIAAGIGTAQTAKRAAMPAVKRIKPSPTKAGSGNVQKIGGPKGRAGFTPATANFVYHEQTNNFVATPTCPSGGTDSGCGRYVENTDRSAAAGFQIYAPETYTLHFKVEFQFFTNEVRVYYTTDGTQPCGSFGTVGNVTQPNGTPCGAGNTTQVSVASYTCTYSDQTQSCQIVDVVTATIPPQATGTTVKYIVSAWHSGGGSEIFANSGACGGCVSATSSSDATVFQYDTLAPPATSLIISEFRLRGPGPSPTPTAAQQAADEYVEIYNNSDSDVTVIAFDGSAGFALAASDGVTRFTIPNTTVIPARGHYLGVNSTGYSLASYPAGNGTTATGDATYTTDIPDNAGIALFNTANPANFTLTNRLDAAGSTAEANTLYKEGTGYTAITPFNIDYCFYRDLNNSTGTPKDTDDNASDFVFVDTAGTITEAGQRLGAPGPENSTSPIQRNALVKAALIDTGCTTTSVGLNSNPVGGTCPRVRDATTVGLPGSPTANGTLSIRRTFVNNTGSNVTRLRFRIVDITTLPATGTADLRAQTSTDVTATCVSTGSGCPSGTGSTVTIYGTTLEQPPTQSTNGGGYNSSLSADAIQLATPLAPGNKINVQFLLGIAKGGTYRFFINVEALP